MKSNDDRILCRDSHTLIHQILNRIRECEKYNIDYDAYLNKSDFYMALDILDCCLANKDKKYIERVE